MIVDSTFFDAWQKRMEGVDAAIRRIAAELKERGCEVYTHQDGLLKFIKIVKDGKHVLMGFTDVPYQWYLSYTFPRSIKGNSRQIKARYDPNDPFTADEIMEHVVHPVHGDFFLTYLIKL